MHLFMGPGKYKFLCKHHHALHTADLALIKNSRYSRFPVECTIRYHDLVRSKVLASCFSEGTLCKSNLNPFVYILIFPRFQTGRRLTPSRHTGGFNNLCEIKHSV